MCSINTWRWSKLGQGVGPAIFSSSSVFWNIPFEIGFCVSSWNRELFVVLATRWQRSLFCSSHGKHLDAALAFRALFLMMSVDLRMANSSRGAGLGRAVVQPAPPGPRTPCLCEARAQRPFAAGTFLFISDAKQVTQGVSTWR